MSAAAKPSVKPIRWAILSLLFAATILNYLDRQALSILAPIVQKDLGIDDAGYARIVQYFLIAYTASYLVAGWITDKLGTKWSLALFLGWWSLANMATGLVRNAAQLGFARFMLGMGEPGVYTAGPKAVAEHFPPSERGLAIGIYTAGAMVGATLAPPLIGWLAIGYGWRMAFVATSAAGFFWLIAWFFVYPKSDHSVDEAAKEPVPWRSILTDRTIWGLAAARMIADPVWYFYLFWFPKYLSDARGMSLIEVASLAWLVYLAADIGSVGGGWFSGRLIQRGIAPVKSRLIAIACGAAIVPFGMVASVEPALSITLALGAVVAFGHLVFQINLGALIVDLYPSRYVATIFGFIAAGSGLGGIFSTQFVGNVVSQGSYSQVFLFMGILHPIALAVILISSRSKSRNVPANR